MSDQSSILHDSGRLLFLDELWQYRTHRGLLMGQPTRELNQWEIAQTVQKARQRYGTVALLQPVERVIEIPPDDPDFCELLAHVPKLQPVGIPWTTCVGLFRSFPAARNLKECYSYLAVVWYQEQFALPIAGDILAQIKALDWDSLAEDATD
jgi:hypothetical protein